MGRDAYEPLTAQDRAFLVFEDRNTHMHLGGLAIFDGDPLVGRNGAIAIDRIRAHIASCLHVVPRYRQRLAWVPMRGRAVWVDESQFNLEYHVRHTAVPRPGGEPELRELASRIMSQQLDRGKPLWELWVITGLRGGRFGVLVKSHHALADGIAAFDLFAALLRPTPDDAVAAIEPWIPRPSPSTLSLLRDEVLAQVATPLNTVRGLWGALRDSPDLGERVRDAVRSVLELAGAGVRPPMDTPLNRPIGPHRRFDWLSVDLAAAKMAAGRLGGTVNDVVLATVAGAVRRFLTAREAPLHGEFRVIVPVSVRGEDERGQVNNRVAGWLVTLPIAERSVLARYEAVCATTARLKAEHGERGPEMLVRVADYALPGLLTLGVRLTSVLRPYNLIVTNVPGPQIPLYLLGARMRSAFPLVPLFESQALGIAIFSHDGRLCFGVNADWDLVSDLDEFVRALRLSFRELIRAAERAPKSPPRLKGDRAAAKSPSSARSSAG